jgi:hypothetical protein
MATLDGGIDDPDGLGGPDTAKRTRSADDEGWDLDAPEVPGDEDPDTDPV